MRGDGVCVTCGGACIRWKHGLITQVTRWKPDSRCSDAPGAVDLVVVQAEGDLCCYHFRKVDRKASSSAERRQRRCWRLGGRGEDVIQ